VPKYFKVSDPDFFDAITPEEMRWTGQATREVMPGWDLGSIVLGDDSSDPNVPVASMLKIAAGDTLPKHAHDCFRVEVIVQGSITLPGGDVLTSGDVMFSRPGEFYGPHIAGPDGCLSVEIFSAARGTAPIADETDGSSSDVTGRVHEATARLQNQTA